MKLPKPLQENPSTEEKIAFLLAVIDYLEKDAKENRLLKNWGYGGAGASGAASGLAAQIPDLAQIFPASVDPTQLWYVIPVLLLFSLSMKRLEEYQKERASEATKVLETLKSQKPGLSSADGSCEERPEP